MHSTDMLAGLQLYVIFISSFSIRLQRQITARDYRDYRDYRSPSVYNMQVSTRRSISLTHYKMLWRLLNESARDVRSGHVTGSDEKSMMTSRCWSVYIRRQHAAWLVTAAIFTV